MTIRLAVPVPMAPDRATFRAGRSPLPPRLRDDAALGVLDATEWFGETSGGIRTYLMEKARYVAARPDLRHTIVVPGQQDAIEDRSGVRFVRLEGPPIPRHRPYRFMLATRSVSRIVRHERPDIIEVGSPFVVPWIVSHATRDLGIPMVCYHHTDVAGVLSRNFPTAGGIRRRVAGAAWQYLRWLERRCAMTIVATAGGARDLQAHGISRVAHVPLGVDLGTFSPSRRAYRAEVRARLGLPDAPLALFAGRFAREKELHVILDAWAQVEAACGARLVLVGAGPDEARLRAHAYADRVFFLPFMHDRAALADLLAAADVYVAAGPAETFGLSAVEAMACGTPVLSAGRGAVAEHVVRSGAGRTYDAGSAASASQAAVSLFDDDLAHLGARAHAFAASEHEWSTVFDRLFAVYRQILATQP